MPHYRTPSREHNLGSNELGGARSLRSWCGVSFAKSEPRPHGGSNTTDEIGCRATRGSLRARLTDRFKAGDGAAAIRLALKPALDTKFNQVMFEVI